MKIKRFRLAAFLLVASLFIWAVQASAADAPGEGRESATGEAIRLQRILVPSAGSAAFYISEGMIQQVTSVSGIFAMFGAGGPDVYSTHSARVHYTVLSADGDGVRLLVRAQPVDAGTGLPIAPVRWEATYLVTAEGPVFESGDEVPGSYGDIVEPSWLTDWSAVVPSEIPTEPLLPGTGWSGPANFAWDQLGVAGLDVPIIGTFTGWVDAGGFGSAAHISEGLEASGSVLQPFAEGVFANHDVAVELVSDHWLLPGDFPFGTEKRFLMNTVTSLGPSTGAPEGVEGEYRMTIELSQSIFRDDNSEFWLPYEEKNAIRPGETVSGVFGVWSDTLEDGTYVKAYALQGTEGEVFDIYLSSPDFDAYLAVLDDAGNYLVSDDDSAGGTDAYVNFEVPSTGVFYVLANTYGPGTEGLYFLTVLPAEE